VEITKSQKRLFIILGLVIIYGIYDIISNFDTYFSFYTGQKQEKVSSKNNNDKILKPKLKQSSRDYIKTWGSDPFYIVVKSKKAKRVPIKSAPKLHLLAIIYDEPNSIAMINDAMVKTGDMISGYRIVNIKQNSVTVTYGNKTTILTLGND